MRLDLHCVLGPSGLMCEQVMLATKLDAVLKVGRFTPGVAFSLTPADGQSQALIALRPTLDPSENTPRMCALYRLPNYMSSIQPCN